MPRKVLTSKDAKSLTVDFEEQAIVKRQLSPFRVLAELGCSELYQYAAKKVGSINPVCLKEMGNGIPGNYKVIYYGVLTTFLVHDTGKSFSEALILALTNPQYDKRLFIDLPVLYMKTTSSDQVCT